MTKYDVAVIGGGAAGMACAYTLACGDKNLKIIIIEAAERLGKKLSSTGNGQGNVSNTDMRMEHFRGGNLKLIEKIACTDENAVTRLFNCVFSADEKGRLYPSGRQASALTDSMLRSFKLLNVDVLLSAVVASLEKGYKIALVDGRTIIADCVVICTGGVAQPVCKSLSPYSFAEKFGHIVTPVYPSLVQLKTDTDSIKTLKGIRADCGVTAYLDGKAVKRGRGDVIFTDYGVSGNAIFAISPIFACGDEIDKRISIEFLPDVPREILIADIERKKKLNYGREDLLSGTLHNQIGRAVVRRAGTSDANKITETLKNFMLNVRGTTGFAYAQVTRGGIDMAQITDGLESKLSEGLYFAGEVLDVDGDCGGYNLQWAFSSGIAAARSILERMQLC